MGEGADRRQFPDTYRPPIILKAWSRTERDCLDRFNWAFPGFGGMISEGDGETRPTIHNPAQLLCKGAKSAMGLVNCFKREYGRTGESRWAAFGCNYADQNGGRFFFEAYPGACPGRNAPCVSEYVALYPEPDPLERECRNLILTSGPADTSGERLAKSHAIYTLCEGTPNPYDTFRCFSKYYADFVADAINAGMSEPDLDLGVDVAVDRCRHFVREALGDEIPPLDVTDLNQCQASAENIIQAFLSNVTVLGSGCDGATVCGAVADASPEDITGWVTSGGAAGFAQNALGDDPKGFLWEALGCAAEVGLGQAQEAAGASQRIKFADLCAFSPDQLAKTITASLACGNVHVRDGGSAAACSAGKTRGHDLFDRFKRLIFVPGKPQCLTCPPGMEPANNKWTHLSSEPRCYTPCPADTHENFFFPSYCLDGTERRSAPATITSKSACPAGQFVASKLFTEDTFCLSGCNGLAIGETCFGVKTNPDAVRAALAGLKPRN
jgi:hypothetical protein